MIGKFVVLAGRSIVSDINSRRLLVRLVCVPALFVIALMVLAGCSLQPANPSFPTETALPAAHLPVLPLPAEPGTFQPAVCRFAVPEDLVEGDDVECGYLTVPERREGERTSESRLIQLAVAVFHPPGGATRSDPLVYLSGGPGASALEMIRYGFEDLSRAAFESGRDLVFFDQRGVGLSLPALDCPAYDRQVIELLGGQQEGQALSKEQVAALALENILACGNQLSQFADLSAYNSASSAADVADLWRALGYQEINLWGGSYGTRLALDVMRRYPEGLRSVVLEAVYPPDVDLYVEAPANFNRALERLFESCAANDVCQREYPDLRQVFFDTVARLNADPVTSEIYNPFSGEEVEAPLDGDTLLGLIFQILYDSRWRYLLPKYVYAASEGDFTIFNHMRSIILDQSSISSRGMMFSVQCNEELAFSSLENLDAELARYPQLSGMYTSSLILGRLSYRVCQEWGAGRADARGNQPVHSSLPVLILSGEFDPITPPAWGERVAATLENAFTYEYPGIGHGASTVDPCPQSMLLEFLDEPASPPDDSCIESMRMP